MSYRQSTAEAFDQALRDADISRDHFAVRIGKSRMWVHRRVTGQTPITVDDLELIATALAINPADLLDGTR
jgi:transcriptional regulator with XRE-family HTH domain